MTTIQVVVADDCAVIRAGVKTFFQDTSDIAVVGEAQTGSEALQLVQHLHPDVLMLDIAMKEMSGIAIAQSLRAYDAGPSMLVLSDNEDTEHILAMFAYGAAGYLTKDETPQIIIDAVRGVARGEQGWISRRIVTHLFKPSKHTQPQLTSRELDILQGIVHSKRDCEIGQELHIAERTVRYGLQRIYDKLGVHTRIEAVAQAIRLGLVE
ncbi:MAG: response regulator transcription factor [Chloroflexi bacterium AL-W]|nr:response regulator transcription factor [Chloroflexi bacterium AL-N1]NOK69510.1 response regulator transcription factor [Chloroflexi bacterium AL-N10]NOK77475.1 response regulator transcription factor [Chloroflexi bacterium AL-N5]NOK84326.1 response regulator transcription factor [Chloroflexi bacterium AL-W]NOK91508.1 response regulator transcription factor [Chloroflexi bacterium AL-N15]